MLSKPLLITCGGSGPPEASPCSQRTGHRQEADQDHHAFQLPRHRSDLLTTSGDVRRHWALPLSCRGIPPFVVVSAIGVQDVAHRRRGDGGQFGANRWAKFPADLPDLVARFLAQREAVTKVVVAPVLEHPEHFDRGSLEQRDRGEVICGGRAHRRRRLERPSRSSDRRHVASASVDALLGARSIHVVDLVEDLSERHARRASLHIAVDRPQRLDVGLFGRRERRLGRLGGGRDRGASTRAVVRARGAERRSRSPARRARRPSLRCADAERPPQGGKKGEVTGVPAQYRRGSRSFAPHRCLAVRGKGAGHHDPARRGGA